MSKVAGVLVALLIVGIVTTARGAHASRPVCPGTTGSSTHGSTHTVTRTTTRATPHPTSHATTSKHVTPGK